MLAGIVFALIYPINQQYPAIISGILLVVLVVTAIFGKKINYRNRWIFGVIIFIFLINTGYQITIINTEKNKPVYFGEIYQSGDIWLARLSEPLIKRAKTNKAIVKMESLYHHGKWFPISGNAIIYFKNDSLSSLLKYGEQVLLNSKLSEIFPPKNPHEFDYKQYLSNKGIYHSSYATSSNWFPTGKGYGNPVRKYAYRLRDYFLNIFEKHGIQGKEYAVASALILGYTDKLDADLLREYSGSGAMHILSVSGLHVGIVYIVLEFLLFFMNRRRWLKIIKTVIIFLFIWFYAFITGLSPAVLRSSVMISFIVIGSALSQKPSIYNTLAASAFILLLYNPFYITEVGFQLSYLAVTGIVMLQKPIYNLWLPPNRVAEWIWAMVAVSIAAQLATFPLSLFYFHQFPNYFLITNLIAIPLSSLVIYLGALVLFTSSFAWLCNVLSWIMVILLKGLNFTVQFVEQLPYAISYGITLNNVQLFLLYSLLFSILIYLSMPNRRTFYPMVFCVSMFVISVFYQNLVLLNRHQMVVYNFKKHTVCDFIHGNTFVTVKDGNVEENLLSYSVMPNRIHCNLKIKPEDFAKWFFQKKNFICFDNKKIAIIKEKPAFAIPLHKLRVDYLLMSSNMKMKMREIVQYFDTPIVIFDASNSPWRIQNWIKECKTMHLKYYSTQEQGAYVVNF